MTDIQPDSPVDDDLPVDALVDDHQDSDGPADLITFVRSGVIRLVIAGQDYSLRRPYFGELRDLRGALEYETDQLDDIRATVRAKAEELRKAEADLQADEAITPQERQDAVTAMLQELRVVTRRLTDAGESSRVAWWDRVFNTLAVNGRRPQAEHLPTWVADGALASRVMAHWRSSPLARG